MRACAITNAICFAAFLAVSGFAACTTSPPAETPPAATDASSAAPPGDTAPPDPASSAAQSGSGKAKKAETVADCKELLTEITNEPPDAGVVMNNAMTAGDAGSSDRFGPMLDLMKQKRDAFRCCFDIWARKNPGAGGRMTFVFELGPDGKLKKAFAKQDETDIRAPDVESCMVELAGGLSYPKSPSGKDTTYTHRFDFKARN